MHDQKEIVFYSQSELKRRFVVRILIMQTLG